MCSTEDIPIAQSALAGRLALLVGLLLVPFAESRADALADCSSDEPARVVDGCSDLIQQGRLIGGALAVAFGRRADGHLGKGEIQKALADRLEALKLDPKNSLRRERASDTHRLVGDQLAAKGDDEGGINQFTAAIELDNGNHVAYASRSRAYFNLNNITLATKDMTQAKALAPDNEVYRLGIGWFYFERAARHALRSDFKKAIADYTEALKTNASEARIYLHRADAYVGAKDLSRAIENYDKAIELNPKFGEAVLRRGELRLREGQMESALADFREVIMLEPNNVHALLLRALVYERTDYPGQAKGDYETVLRIEPSNKEAASGLKRAAALSGEVASTIPPEKSTDVPEGQTTEETELMKAVQRALKAVGCDPGDIDGIWGDESKEALSRFAKITKADVDLDDPDQETLAAVTGRTDKVCIEGAQGEASVSRFDGVWVVRWRGTGEKPCKLPDGSYSGSYTIRMTKGTIEPGPAVANVKAGRTSRGKIAASGAARWTGRAVTDGEPIHVSGQFSEKRGSGRIARPDGRCTASFVAARP